MHSTLRLTRLRTLCLTLVWCVVGTSAWAGGNHTQASYRALEGMPELSQAPRAVVESLDTFLRAQEQTLEALLASQEAWAMAAVEYYPALPDALAFVANLQRSDEARRQAFLAALLAPCSSAPSNRDSAIHSELVTSKSSRMVTMAGPAALGPSSATNSGTPMKPVLGKAATSAPKDASFQPMRVFKLMATEKPTITSAHRP